MKLLVAGSRSITNFNLKEYIPEDVDLIISGGASGIDRIAEAYADKKNISKLILRPDYKRYGRYAPLKRNEKMIEIADSVLVIWDGKSRGSAYTIRYAEACGKNIAVVNTSEQSISSVAPKEEM